ncbi:MAG: hypothetical protein ACPLZF_00850 [Nitrososphaeria archaeon]
MVNFVPPEYAWIIPVIVPFIIGLIVGVIIKRALKLVLALIILLIVLVAVGYTQLPTFEEIARAALKYLPILWAEASPLTNILPYSSITFLLGLALGLWKG